MPLKNKLLAVQKPKHKEQEIYSASIFNQIYKHVQNIELHIEKVLIADHMQICGYMLLYYAVTLYEEVIWFLTHLT